MLEPVWIDEVLAVALHERLLVLHGGAGGLRDSGLLASALARPEQLNAYGEDVDLFDLAGAYAGGIVKNHPFVDGNKRTGFVVCVLFLELNGLKFNATEEAAAEAVLALASGAMDSAGFTRFLRANSTTDSE
jgi:death-on-curing protein